MAVDQPSKLTDPKGAVDPATAANSKNHPVDIVLSVTGTQDPSPIQELPNQPSGPSGSGPVAASSAINIPFDNSNNAFTARVHAFTPQSGSGVIVVGNTLTANGPAAKVSGTAVSLASSGLIIGSQTFVVPTPAPEPKTSPSTAFTMGGHTATPRSDSSVYLCTQHSLERAGPMASIFTINSAMIL